MSQDNINQQIRDILNHHQKCIELAQEHLRALYASQQFLLSEMLEASPAVKDHIIQALDQVLGQSAPIEHRYLLQTLRDLREGLQRPKAMTPEERRARLYLAWPPKPAPPEGEAR